MTIAERTAAKPSRNTVRYLRITVIAAANRRGISDRLNACGMSSIRLAERHVKMLERDRERKNFDFLETQFAHHRQKPGAIDMEQVFFVGRNNIVAIWIVWCGARRFGYPSDKMASRLQHTAGLFQGDIKQEEMVERRARAHNIETRVPPRDIFGHG